MSDDPTKVIGDTPPTPPTQPTIETVLDRINQLGERLSGEIQATRADIAALDGRVKEIDAQIRLMNRKLDDIGKDLLDVRARVGVAEDRLDDLERKAS